MKYKIGNYILVNNKNKIEFRKINKITGTFGLENLFLTFPIDDRQGWFENCFDKDVIVCKANNLLHWAYL